jgi:hypothetical protein
VVPLKSREIAVAGATLILVTYVLALSLTGQVLSAAPTSKTVSNAGTVRAFGVGVYKDSKCTNALSSIDWGTLEPGSSEDFTCYVRNELSSASTLSMYTSNWSPLSASDYMSLSWDYGGQSIEVDEVVQVTFTLSVDANIEGITNFSFDITIAANS